MLETKIDALTAAIGQLIAVMSNLPAQAPNPQSFAPQQAAPPQQQYQATAPQPVYQQPPQQNVYAPPGTMPVAPTFQAPAVQAYPFHDNVTAATWAKGVWGQAAAINQEAAIQKFGAMMQGLGLADFDSLTPDKFPALFAGTQQIKAEMGIPG